MTEPQDQTRKHAQKSTLGDFSTPHDAILAQGGEHNPVNPATNTWVPSVLYDPFDASVLGHLNYPAAESHNPEFIAANGFFSQNVDDGNKEEQWVHLSRVLALQNEVAKMHLDMEGMGPGDGKGKGIGAGRSRGKSVTESTRREWGGGVRNGPSSGGMAADPVHEGDEEGVGAAGDEEIDIKRAREEKFANLAHEFEGRTESIKDIMNKLDELSKSLTEFHTLQAPTFQLAKPGSRSSRQGSVTPDGSPPPAQVKNPTSNLSKTALHPVLPHTHSTRGTLSVNAVLPGGYEGSIESSIIPSSLSRSSGPGKAAKATNPLVVNSLLEPEKQTRVMESSDSTGVRASLPPEETG